MRCFVTDMINARTIERVSRAIEGQGPGFVEFRTPPRDLLRDARGRIVPPPVELVGDDVRPRTREVLSGKAATTWGWPR
jgi:hypothetical protein